MFLSPSPHSVAPTPTSKGTAGFTQADRLRRRAEYLRVQTQGRRVYSRHFGVTLAPADSPGPRLGLVVTRRFGKAAKRNRMKRLLREFFRRHKSRLPSQDVVIMAKQGAEALNYYQVAEELGLLLLPRRAANHD